MNQAGTPDALADFERVAVELTRQAGQMALEALRSPPLVEFKDEKRRDPVTETDRRIEDFLRAELRQRFPEHGLLGEERDDEAVAAEYLWVMDPLDGTANFANGLPLFAVALALLRRGAPVVGCLFVPLGPGGRAGVLHAARGCGAHFDGEPIHVAAADAKPPRLAALPGGWQGAFELRGAATKQLADQRNLGSICLEGGQVACGTLRWAIFLGPKLWDVAAASVLVQEAGGLARTWSRRQRAWQNVERFETPTGKNREGKPLTLRDWSRPTLLGTPEAVEALTRELRWHRGVPRWLRRLVRAWQQWRKGRGKDRSAKKPAPPSSPSPREEDPRQPPLFS